MIFIVIYFFLALFSLSVAIKNFPLLTLRLKGGFDEADEPKILINIAIDKLKDTVTIENVPNFKFKKDMTDLLIENSVYNNYDNLIQLEMIYDEYMNLIRDYYLNLFQSRIVYVDDNRTSSVLHDKYDEYECVKVHILNEFIIAVNQSRPELEACIAWNTEVKTLLPQRMQCVTILKCEYVYDRAISKSF